jgi:inorganic pyrophosphatase
METLPKDPIWDMMGLLFKAHPWHGVPIGDAAPEIVTTYIEIVPSDTVKYELDKLTGHLKVDRPQAFSNICPTIYGFVPRTYCADKVAELCNTATGRTDIVGDGDPLDICVLCEKVIPHGDILLQARPIGGLRMIDGDEADDKIIAVMVGDAAYGNWRDIGDCPRSLVDRLRHYFLTYKQRPGEDSAPTEITDIYDREIAQQVIRRSQQDYQARFGEIEGVLTAALRG